MLFGILIYDNVEPIDLATYGVLSMARRIRPEIEIRTISPRGGVVCLANGLRVIADHAIADAPALDCLVVTGGPGWVEQAQAPETLAFIRRQAATTHIVSVCTGAMILAASGVLDGRSATTKRETVPPEEPPIERLRRDHPRVTLYDGVLVDGGTIVTGGGVSLCIDTILHVLGCRFGADMAAETARILEYHRARAANLTQFPPLVVPH